MKNVVEIVGRYFQAEKPALKTIHKDGEVVIGGFEAVSGSFDECWESGAYDGQACDLCPHGAECSGKEAEE